MSPEALAALHARAFAGEAARPWSAAEFAALLPGALLAGDARAFAMGRVTLDEAEVLTVATDPAHRRQGLARQALRGLEAMARERGAARAFLEVAEENRAALALYEGEGWERIGRRRDYHGPGCAALVLQKLLAV
jgi:[ribosomal protein S18]-alanine N-acetyltransferase